MLFDGVFTVEFKGHVPADKVARRAYAARGTGMRIDLDAPGPDGKPVPHWLSKPAPAGLKLIVRKVGPRQLRLALRDRPRHLRIVK